ncbi:MAG: tetratricopeptide repeat protein, partial [Phycicoccus sp.]|nr:tetratricopeptide repeat protein [Phycicoccus sp.]
MGPVGGGLTIVGGVLDLLGVDGDVVAAVAASAGVSDAIPARLRRLGGVSAKAAVRLDDAMTQKSSQLQEHDREAALFMVNDVLRKKELRDDLYGAALRGPQPFTELVRANIHPDSSSALSEAGHAYLHALVGQIYLLVSDLATDDAVLGVASRSALHQMQSVIAVLPTQDQLTSQVAHAVTEALRRRPRQIIDGERPRLASQFVNRAELDALRSAMANPGVATICSLQGMRGVGKSQLASAFAQACEDNDWTFVGWVNAESRAGIIRELAAMARRADVTAEPNDEAATRRMLLWLSGTGPHSRLLVLDNVEDSEDLTGLVPRGPGMRVIVTSTEALGLGTVIDVGMFDTDQAVQVLLTRTGLTDRAGAEAVAMDLGHLPLAITQAGAAIELLGYSFEEYRTALRQLASLDNAMERPANDPYPRLVGTALSLSLMTALDRLQEELGQDGAAIGQVLLGSLALLADGGVPRSWFLSGFDDEHLARRVVGRLARWSVVTLSQDRMTVSLHRLVASTVRERMSDETRASAVRLAVKLVGHPLPQVGPTSLRRDVVILLGGQLAAVRGQRHSEVLWSDSSWRERALTFLFEANAVQAPTTAMGLVGYVTDSERVLGPEHPDTLTSRNNLAGAYESAGDLAKAIPLYQATLTDRERILGPEHPNTLTSRNNLAGAYESAGDLAKAIPLYQATLTDRERILGPEHPNTLTSRNNLASAYRSAGDLAKAIPLYQATLTDSERILGPEHPDTLTSRNNLAGAYVSAGDLAKAIPLYQATLTDR